MCPTCTEKKRCSDDCNVEDGQGGSVVCITCQADAQPVHVVTLMCELTGCELCYPPETLTISRADLDAIKADAALLTERLTLMGGLVRILLSSQGGALCYGEDVVEDALDDVDIIIRPARQAISPRDILGMIEAGVDLDTSWVASLKPRKKEEVLRLKGLRVEARKKKAQAKAAQELLKTTPEKAAGLTKGKGRLVLLGSSEGQDL